MIFNTNEVTLHPAGTRAIQVTLSFHEQPRVVQRGNAGDASQHIKATRALYQTCFIYSK